MTAEPFLAHLDMPLAFLPPFCFAFIHELAPSLPPNFQLLNVREHRLFIVGLLPFLRPKG